MREDKIVTISRNARRLVTVVLALVGMYCFAAISIAVYGLQNDIAIADVAIIPGNTVQRDGLPSPRLAARLDKAAQLHREKQVKDIIVSGGPGEEGYDEAAVMKRYLTAHGIPEENIIADSNGVTTWRTAKNAAGIMKAHGWKSAIVISQYFHIPRTRLALDRFGISPIYSAHADFFELRDIYSTLREVTGYIDYLFRMRE